MCTSSSLCIDSLLQMHPFNIKKDVCINQLPSQSIMYSIKYKVLFKLQSKLEIRPLYQCLILPWYYSLVETGWTPGYSPSIFLSPPLWGQVEAGRRTHIDRWSSPSNERGKKCWVVGDGPRFYPQWWKTFSLHHVSYLFLLKAADEVCRWATFDGASVWHLVPSMAVVSGAHTYNTILTF